MAEDMSTRVAAFIREVVSAMGLPVEVQVQQQPDHLRIDLSGEGADLFVRRRGEALEALQHIVNTVFRREVRDGHHFFIDALNFRRAKEAELRQMTQLLIERVKASGAPQQMGPLNPYSRRVVHLTVAEDPSMTSESIGDAFLKTVIISHRDT